jgi:hypothetical protein
VYLSATELLDLEHARLKLRRFGYSIDRGRLVREAVAVLLADLDARGPESLIARRLRADHNPENRGLPDNRGFPENTVPSLPWAELRVTQ